MSQRTLVSVVDHILPKQNAKKEHQHATPWRHAPAFVKTHVAKFRQGEATRAALTFLISTAARSGEVRGTVWDEFDLEAGTWAIRAARMRAEIYRVAVVHTSATTRQDAKGTEATRDASLSVAAREGSQ